MIPRSPELWANSDWGELWASSGRDLGELGLGLVFVALEPEEIEEGGPAATGPLVGALGEGATAP